MCKTIYFVSCLKILAIVLVAITVTVEPVTAGVGYNCNRLSKEIKTLSITDIDDCEIENDNVNATNLQIAIVNLDNVQYTDIIQCKVEVQVTIEHCGKRRVRYESSEYTYPVTREMCERAHENGTMLVGNTFIKNLQVFSEYSEYPLWGSTYSYPIIFAGDTIIDIQGNYHEVSYTCNELKYLPRHTYRDPFRTWDNVIVSGTASITLTKHTVETKVDSDKIILPKGTQCKLSDGNCIDTVGGYTFWKSLPGDDCNVRTYATLFKGEGTKIVSKTETLYSVNVKDTRITLRKTGNESSCGVTILKTEHPNLFIVEHEGFEQLHANGIADFKPADDTDIFELLDSKFMHVARSTKKGKSIYRDYMKNKCKLEKENLKFALSFATQPDLLAYHIMQRRGYMAVMAGETVHIVQCSPEVFQISFSEMCYNRLPIKIGNYKLFVTPVTHIITKSAAELPCDTPLLEKYKIDESWITIEPNRYSIASFVRDWTLTGSVSSDNMDKAIKNIRERFMFPLEKEH